MGLQEIEDKMIQNATKELFRLVPIEIKIFTLVDALKTVEATPFFSAVHNAPTGAKKRKEFFIRCNQCPRIIGIFILIGNELCRRCNKSMAQRLKKRPELYRSSGQL